MSPLDLAGVRVLNFRRTTVHPIRSSRDLARFLSVQARYSNSVKTVDSQAAIPATTTPAAAMAIVICAVLNANRYMGRLQFSSSKTIGIRSPRQELFGLHGAVESATR
jgi:hypothetical protein